MEIKFQARHLRLVDFHTGGGGEQPLHILSARSLFTTLVVTDLERYCDIDVKRGVANALRVQVTYPRDEAKRLWRCGLDTTAIDGGINGFGGSGADCSLSSTNPSPVYDPSVTLYRIPCVVHVLTNGSTRTAG